MSDDFSGLDLVQLIDLLEPVPEPAPIGLWPQTIGWLGVLVVVLGLAALIAVHYRKRHRANAYRRAALAELGVAGDDPAEIAQIIRRTAIVAYGRRRVASLSGESWLGFLDDCIDGGVFRDGHGQAIALAPYRKDAGTEGLSELAADWIRRHKAIQ